MKPMHSFQGDSISSPKTSTCRCTAVSCACLITVCVCVQAGAQALPEGLRFGLGRIGIEPQTTPARVAFDFGNPTAETRGSRAAEWSRQVLEFHTGDPGTDLVMSVPAAVAAPLVGVASMIAGAPKLDDSQMQKAEGRLTAVLEKASDQVAFQARLVAAARGSAGRELIVLDGRHDGPEPVDTILRGRVEEIRLASATHGMHALNIRARVQLVRTADGIPIQDRVLTYQSEADLFVNWTRGDGLTKVYQTGLNRLAHQFASESLSVYDVPIATGSLATKTPRPTSTKTQKVRFSEASSPAKARLIGSSLGTLGVFPDEAPILAIQHPADSDRELPDAVYQVEWQLEGLQNHPNSVISMGAMVAAIPMSLYGQIKEGVSKIGPEKRKTASANLVRATLQQPPMDTLGASVASALQVHTPQPVMFVKGPIPVDATTGSPRFQFVSGIQRQTWSEHAIRMRIVRAGLTGKGQYNPSLRLNMEVQADVVRLSDGLTLLSVPMTYAGDSHRYTKWADKDGRLLREEIERAGAEMSQALAGRLVDRGFLPGAASTLPVLARN